MNAEDARHIARLAHKRWSCGVVRSGTHNGAGCTPRDSHGGWWQCGYRYELSIDAEAVDRAIT